MRAAPLFRPSNSSFRLALIVQSKSSDLSFFSDEAVSERNPDTRVSCCNTSSPLQSPCLAAPRWAGLLTYSFPPQISSPTTLFYRHVRPGSISTSTPGSDRGQRTGEPLLSAPWRTGLSKTITEQTQSCVCVVRAPSRRLGI